MKKKTSTQGKPQSDAQSTNETGIPFEQVRQLIDLLEERGLEEFEFERAGVRIRIKRRGVAPAPPPVFESYMPSANNAAAPYGGNSPSVDAQARTAAEMGVALEDVHIINSPIVGTFYAAPRPDAPPLVRLGDRVEVGQVLCIIEAMKLMNEIEADVAGEIARIYAENGQPVEYGEHLFAIRPSKKK
ncbi:MAG TPA: acetyl-CoA carboxylase biotin carboxyl carrier protein [Candidatus Acidoferrales bacterium]|nr:acetyl-CoA carboxylase biotin carboxyl carrier protein [Candidatus Acidoferrales bacterium]